MADRRTKEDLTPQEKLFCEYYCEIGGDSYSNGTQSAKRAGYSTKSTHSAAWRLLRRPAIREYCQELWQNNCDEHNITPHRVLSDLEDTRRRASAAQDYSVVARCIELTGKYLSMWKERFDFTPTEEQERLDEQRAAEARRIAQISLRERYQGNLGDTPPNDNKERQAG
jgi:phage terminase small subunit